MRHTMTAGERYGRLVTLFQTPKVQQKRRAWLCRCDCGNEKVVTATHLRAGDTVSCGCFKLQRIRETQTKHGRATRGGKTPEYKCWVNIGKRCNPDSVNKQTKHYGARGIRVCDRWKDSFTTFLEDMGQRPSARHSIERLDVNGHYEPRNCVWATQKTQQNNKRSNRRIDVGGVSMTISQASEITDVGVATLRWRVRKGWSVEEALSRPPSPLRSQSRSPQRRASSPISKTMPARRYT